ncbi:MAG TPA: hypothetical protein VFF27_05320 [Bacteroidia bacterium]|jgi:hypothetical protein|nr:hypothetical protein [Bacteroidia bacterium]
MDRNTIKKEIIGLVNSIKSQSDTLAEEKYPSQIDLELFLHKVEKLYQKSIVFNHLSIFDGFEEPEQAPTHVMRSIPAPEPVIQKEERPLDQPILAKAPVIVQETVQKPTTEPKVEVAKPVRKLADLKLAMGINDKFQFTNELFKGNMPEFNIAVEQLNASESIESAMNYLKSLHDLYGWEDEHETVKRFMNIVEKRYS